jgi:ribonuclease P protein component
MIPRSLRLTRKGFEQARGLRRTASPHFAVSYGPADQSNGGSAIVVPKKVVKSAVGRHLLKRRIRAVLKPRSSKDAILVVFARSGAADLSFQELERELSSLLEGIMGGIA